MIWYDYRVTSLMSREQKWSKSATPSCTDQVRTQCNQAHSHTRTHTWTCTLSHPLTHPHAHTHTQTHKYSRLQVVNRMARRVHRLTLTRAFFSCFSILFVTSYILHLTPFFHNSWHDRWFKECWEHGHHWARSEETEEGILSPTSFSRWVLPSCH